MFGYKTTKLYEGEIVKNEFNLTRIIRHRNSFRPVITGIIKPDSTATIIEVKMRNSRFYNSFLVFMV